MQLQKLLSEKSKMGFDKLDDALSLFRRMAQIRPLPSVINFTQLLTAVVKMKEYSTVISLYKEIHELGIPINEYTLTLLINCVCRLSRVDYGFAFLGIFFKCGYTPNMEKAEQILQCEIKIVEICKEMKQEVMYLSRRLLGEARALLEQLEDTSHLANDSICNELKLSKYGCLCKWHGRIYEFHEPCSFSLVSLDKVVMVEARGEQIDDIEHLVINVVQYV
ncbi:hypothetical protein RHSIM_Rhsim02G0033600 [Rhododendron simsii]|uniref:Pentatricopeptide repeat-containing protein n=1 Tax=Rhododendron simsii TaxID=118357 RepID=A0A834LY64_RHOSS|nr:hypothetical protein RHSIM_Rhsim02G0033600 [Rhododendron simsii]